MLFALRGGWGGVLVGGRPPRGPGQIGAGGLREARGLKIAAGRVGRVGVSSKEVRVGTQE